MCSTEQFPPNASDGVLGICRRRCNDRPHAFEVGVSGEIDSGTVQALDREFDAVIEADARFVVLDLRGVTFLDSSGLRSIVRASNELAGRDGRLTCAGLSGAAARVLEISGLLKHLAERGAPN
jgi:anti-anti-sigma factor